MSFPFLIFVRASVRALGASVLLGSPVIGCAAESVPELAGVDLRGNCRGGVSKYPGSTTQRDGTIELSAHGSEIGHHCGEDQGHFAYVEMAGDFDVSVQVAALTNGGAQRYDGHASVAKGGLMVRESIDPAARYVAIWAVSNDSNDNEKHRYPDAYHFDARLDSQAWLGSEPAGRFVYAAVNRKHGELFVRNYPQVWVRLKREGDKFRAFVSQDGQTWYSSFRDQHGQVWESASPHFEVKLPPVVLLGVALASAPEGDRNARSTAVFKDFRGFSAGGAKPTP